MKAAGKVMVVSAMVLALGMVAASDLSAASKNQAPSTDGAIWSSDGAIWGNGNGGGLLSQPVNRGQQHQQASKDQGCFAGTASAHARCIAHSLANKVIGLVEGAIWGGSFGPPPR